MKYLPGVFFRALNCRLRVGAAIGVYDYERAESLIGNDVDVLIVDSAHGHSKNVLEIPSPGGVDIELRYRLGLKLNRPVWPTTCS